MWPVPYIRMRFLSWGRIWMGKAGTTHSRLSDPKAGLWVGGGRGGVICISDLLHAFAEWNSYNYYTPWLPLELYPFWLAFFFSFLHFISIQLINSCHGDCCHDSIKFSQRASHSYSNEITCTWLGGWKKWWGEFWKNGRRNEKAGLFVAQCWV